MLGEASLQTLVHWGAFFIGISLKATVILSLVLVITHLLSTRLAAFQSVILNACMLALLLLPIGALFLPNLPILPRPNWLPTLTPTINETAPPIASPTTNAHISQHSNTPITTTQTPPTQHTSSLQPILLTTLTIYLIGLAIMAFRLCGGLLYTRSFYQTTETIPPFFLQQLKHLVHQLGLKRTIQLTFNTRINSPTQIGVFRPLIILPTHLKTTSNAQLIDMILLHELGHAHRWDCLSRFLALCVRTCYWYHPLAWVATRQFSDIQEQACDDWVVRHTGKMREYAEALLDVTAHMQTSSSLVLGMSFARTTRIVQRVQRLIDNRVHPGIGRWTATTLTVILLLSTSILASLQLLSKLPQILPKEQLAHIQTLLHEVHLETQPLTLRPLSIPDPQPISQLQLAPPNPIAQILAQTSNIETQPRVRYDDQFQKRHVISGKVNMSHVPGTAFTVAIYPSQASTARPLQEVRVNPDGQFTIPYLKPGNYTVALMRATKTKNNTWQKTRVRATNVSLSHYNAHISFQPLGEWQVRGSAYLDNDPVEGAIVAAYSRHPENNTLQMVSGAITDPQGRYLLTDLPHGQIYVGLLKTTPSNQITKRISAVDTLDLRFDGGIPKRVDMKVEYQNTLSPNETMPDITAIDGLITSNR